MVNGFESANESNAAGFPGPPSVARPTLLMLPLVLSDGLIFSCRAGDLIAAPARRSGIVTVCTGVTPPNVLLPPQNALVARRGDVEGRSLWILGVSNDEVDVVLRAEVGAEIGMGPGGGRIGELERPAPPRRAFLSALISCCSAAFSDFVEPSSERIASMRRSRSATSPSSVVIYSVRKYKEVELLERVKRRRILTLATVAKVAGANFVAQLAFFPTAQLLVLLGRGPPVVRGIIVGICLHDSANMDLFLDAARMN
jgi:hypothetical protein